VQQAKKREETLIASISKFLNADQLIKLQQPDNQKSRINWSSETIQRCLGIRAVVGRNGYEHLRHLKFPLPSYRTLCRRVQCAPFAPGIQHDVLAWLKLKMEVKAESEKVCVLLIDEMQLKPQLEYDDGLQKMTGYVSPEALPFEAASSAKMELASHAMIFMLRGLTSSWKQTVAYLFTGTSVKPEPLWEFTKQVIVASEAAGFKIQGVTSDMGPANTGMWKTGSISASSPLELYSPRQFLIQSPMNACSTFLLTHHISSRTCGTVC
jgi:Transposase protein